MTTDGRTDIDVFEAASIDHADDNGIRSMMSRDERALYFDVARRYGGRGEVVELGTWLGSGTFEICRGLEASGHPWHLTALDRFAWTQEQATKFPLPGLAAGDSFLPVFLGNLAPFRDRLTAVAGEIDDLPALMPLPGPVEILYVDAPKSWKLLWRVVDHIGPRLLPGATVVFQDFFHITSRQLIWLAMSIPELRLTAMTRTGTTAVFEASGPVADLAGRVPYDVRALGAAGYVRLWERVRAELPASRLGEVAVGMALDLLGRQAVAEAERVLTEGARGSARIEAVIAQVDRLAAKGNPDADVLGRIARFLRDGTTVDAARRRRA